MKGFTLIEIIISIAILGIIAGITTVSFRNSQIKKQQQAIVETLSSNLAEQKVNSQTGKEGSNYGIKFNTDNYILFKGKVFDSGSSSNKKVEVAKSFQISETISNSQDVIYFSKITGAPSEVATITISHINNKISPQNILIESSGVISVVE